MEVDDRTNKRNFVYGLPYHPDVQTKRKEFFTHYLPKNALCFDIGANIGHISEVFIDMGCKVIAVEPLLYCCTAIQQLLPYDPYLTIVNRAVDNVSNQLKDIHITGVSAISSMSKNWRDAVTRTNRFSGAIWDRTCKVRTITLDKLIQLYGIPDFIKIDVEGFELEVLKGLTQTIDLISIEYTPECLDKTIDCINYLSALGEVSFSFSHNNDMCLIPEILWTDSKTLINYLSTIQNINDYGDVYIRSNLWKSV